MPHWSKISLCTIELHDLGLVYMLTLGKMLPCGGPLLGAMSSVASDQKELLDHMERFQATDVSKNIWHQ